MCNFLEKVNVLFIMNGYSLSFQFFPAHAVLGDLGQEFKGKRDPEGVKVGMVDLVERQSASNRPRSWPKLHLLQ